MTLIGCLDSLDRCSSSAAQPQDGDTRHAKRPQDVDTLYRASSLDARPHDAYPNWNMPETVGDLHSDQEIHSHIVRGRKKSRTGLGELSLPEYNYGLLQVAQLNEGEIRTSIMGHLEEINEEAISYDWEDVRNWTEEICSRIFEGRLL